MAQTIEIQTSYHVPIQFELAPLRERIIAFFIDQLIKGILYFILSYVVQLLDMDGAYTKLLLLMPVLTFYTLICEIWMNGRTLGKSLLGIRVIRIDGQQPAIGDYLLRWSFRMIDIYLSFGLLAAIGISSNERGQRLGDTLAQCTVVRVSKKLDLSLADLMKIESRETYRPQYPQIVHLKESDIFLIKHTIERYQRYKNNAHQLAINELSLAFQEKLQCEIAAVNDVQFLRTLIKDYVVMTR
jgi:uncharacterized RDD family membrane protein YckC